MLLARAAGKKQLAPARPRELVCSGGVKGTPARSKRLCRAMLIGLELTERFQRDPRFKRAFDALTPGYCLPAVPPS